MALRTRQHSPASTVYKGCSPLLEYPGPELLAGGEELIAAVRDLLRSPAVQALERFCPWWAGTDSLVLQQHYVETFDLHKRSGLYLTFYGEGDKRERGIALLRLKRLYRAAGLSVASTELPDYLPLMLEFAAAAPPGYGETVLREHRPALELVRAGLHERRTPYAGVLDAVCLMLGTLSPTDRARTMRLAASGPPQELVGLEPFAPPEVMPGTEARR